MHAAIVPTPRAGKRTSSFGTCLCVTARRAIQRVKDDGHQRAQRKDAELNFEMMPVLAASEPHSERRRLQFSIDEILCGREPAYFSLQVPIPQASKMVGKSKLYV